MKEVLFWGDALKTNLKDLARADVGNGTNGYIEFQLENGTCLGWTLFRDDHGHAIRAFLSKGSVFPVHDHEESFETLVMYRGECELGFVNSAGQQELRKMQLGKPAYLLKGQEHIIYAKEDTWFFMTLVPPDTNL